MAIALPREYEQRVYAGVLGKVVGVYLGRPIEGWSKEKVCAQFGEVDRYIADERKVPLIVADDDITGTFTFIRALADSGRLAESEAADFGECWLNYIVENKSILWWGGLGISTEHTAFLRLKAGIPAPQSGSIALNGTTVAEQIGAQIFIDAIGLVCPGDLSRAARLARAAASVSHDGEAVHAAVVVACLVAGAFVEPDMDRLLDAAVAQIPADSLIARIHREVRAWSRADGNWHATYERIKSAYGYDRHGGGCHVVPNHAIMVMAWAYAPDSFQRSQAIINAAGWDTDCNAANVGSVMGVRLDLDALVRDYDYLAPFGDRVLMPTAQPGGIAGDCAAIALELAGVGRRIAGATPLPAPKDGARWHFSLPHSRQGFLAEPAQSGVKPALTVDNPDGEGLRLRWSRFAPGRSVCAACPLLAPPSEGGYSVAGAPSVWSGQIVSARLGAVEAGPGARLRLVLRHWETATRLPGGIVQGAWTAASAGATASLTIPELGAQPASELLVEIDDAAGASGCVRIDRIAVSGVPLLQVDFDPQRDEKGQAVGWVLDGDSMRGGFSEERQPFLHLVRSTGRGHLISGSLDWADYRLSLRLQRRLSTCVGVALRWQGLRRHLSVETDGSGLRLVLRLHGERVLAETPFAWAIGDDHRLDIEVAGPSVTVSVDGAVLLRGRDDGLRRGGFALIAENGIVGMRELTAEGLVETSSHHGH
jgi:ADP-ribosylglycohydrolase